MRVHKYQYQLIVLLFCLFYSLFAFASEMKNLRNQRYCEVMIGNQPLHVQVYNTIGLNLCPEELWQKLTLQMIKEESKSRFAHKNGPRYWVFDAIINSSLLQKEERQFGGINMRLAGILELGLVDLLRGIIPYREHYVHRKTTWVYDAGKPIFELVNGEGDVYVMQSYSVQREMQTINDLAQLGTKLHLPKNWEFKTRVLKREAHLTPPDEKATVIQDEFLNTYQKESPDFIKQSKE